MEPGNVVLTNINQNLWIVGSFNKVTDTVILVSWNTPGLGVQYRGSDCRVVAGCVADYITDVLADVRESTGPSTGE